MIPTVRSVIERMSETARAEPTWAYWLGRSLQAQTDRPESQHQARVLFTSLAGRPDFYSQLAAEELGLLHISEGEGRGRYIRVEKKPPPPFSGEGHRLASESDQSAAAAEAAPIVVVTAEEMRAARLAALEKRS
jgi:hypothetical protein